MRVCQFSDENHGYSPYVIRFRKAIAGFRLHEAISEFKFHKLLLVTRIFIHKREIKIPVVFELLKTILWLGLGRERKL